MDINTSVVKEPRGMIRIIQIVFAILAFATTSGFDTKTSVIVSCPPGKVELPNFEYPIEYPFKFGSVIVDYPSSCNNATDKKSKERFDMDFSSSAQFFVATGVLSFLYSLGVLVLYIFGTKHYETNPLIPVIDLCSTGVLTIFWLAGSCAWAAGVSDVKYYTSPGHLMKLINICITEPKATCDSNEIGKWASLTISLIFGFSNILLWGASMWFVFKETSFHRKPMTDQTETTGNQNFGGYDSSMGGQQTQSQQQPYAGGY